MSFAIACGSGGYRTVFIHGVLAAFEEAGIRADAYGGTSASTLAAASACIGRARAAGVEYWQYGLDLKQTVENGMSDVSLTTITQQSDLIKEQLFQPNMPRFVVPASAVVTEAGANLTQSPDSRKLGRKLLLSAARRRPHEWVAENLALHLYDSKGATDHKLTPENFEAVAYATSRMMHAWDIPAQINGQAYVDASYLCAIPVVELGELQQFDEIIAIAAEPPPVLYRDVFGTREVPSEVNGAKVHIVMADGDVGKMGADFTDATHEGLATVYVHGQQKGREFLARWSPS